ncbi:MAG: HD domain-containing protein [Candidatus Nanohaloarchaea archaeon]|nr:HD domain-containing protein [Candidatus Nanohaloarchaea archaeon]
MAELDFLLTAVELKDEQRTGWDVRGVTDPESVAAHSWGVAFLCFLFADNADVDRGTAVEMGLLHDIHEAVSGDIMSGGLTDAERAEKKEREEQGFQQLLEQYGGDRDDMESLWREYEERETPVARFVKDMDVLETALQALYYRKNERYTDEGRFFTEWDGMAEFFDGTRGRLHTDTAKQVFDDIRARYEEVER